MLPKTDNGTNAKCQIRQWQSWLAKPLGTRSTSPAPLPLVSLPPPGVGAYHPPMLREQPPHLDLVTGNLDSVTTHQNTTMACSAQPTLLASEADDIHEAPTPSSDISIIEMNPLDCHETTTCPNPEKSLDIPKKIQENSGKFRKIFEGCVADTLTLPLSQEQEVDLLEQISWEDWEEWKVGWGEWTPLRWEGLTMLPRLSIHLLIKTMSSLHPGS